MAEYIEREAAKRAIMSQYLNRANKTKYADVIDAVPAADVVPVRHGRWANGAFGYGHYWCTVCQKEVWSEEEKTNFCPNCGARMDGDEK